MVFFACHLLLAEGTEKPNIGAQSWGLSGMTRAYTLLHCTLHTAALHSTLVRYTAHCYTTLLRTVNAPMSRPILYRLNVL